MNVDYTPVTIEISQETKLVLLRIAESKGTTIDLMIQEICLLYINTFNVGISQDGDIGCMPITN